MRANSSSGLGVRHGGPAADPPAAVDPQGEGRPQPAWTVVLWAGALVAALGLWQGRRAGEPGAGLPGGGGSGAVFAGASPAAPVPGVSAHRAFRAGPSRIGRSGARGPAVAPAPEDVLRYRAAGAITGQAVVDTDGVYFAAHDGYLYGLDRSFRLRFRYALGATAFAGPVLSGAGTLIVGSDAGVVHGVSTAGEARFRYSTGARVETAAALHPEGLLLVASGRCLHAIGSDGSRRWVFEADGKIFTTPAIAPDGRIFFGAQDHRVYALAPDGAERWHWAGERDIDGGPMLVGDQLWVGDDGGYARAFGLDGSPRVVRQLGGYLRAPPALGRGGGVLWNVHGPLARLVGLGEDGRIGLSYRLGRADGPAEGARSGPLVDARGRIYVGSHDGTLHAISAGGRALWQFTTGGGIDSSPVLGPDGTLYFGSRDGVFYGLPAGVGGR